MIVFSFSLYKNSRRNVYETGQDIHVVSGSEYYHAVGSDIGYRRVRKQSGRFERLFQSKRGKFSKH